MFRLPITVPTPSTTSSSFLARTFLEHGDSTIVMGPVGSGKSVMATALLDNLPQTYASCRMCCTSFTTSIEVQNNIELHLEKRNKVRQAGWIWAEAQETSMWPIDPQVQVAPLLQACAPV